MSTEAPVLSKGAVWMAREIERRGWSQNETERRLDAPKGAVSRWLSGKRKPGLEYAGRIAKTLGVKAPAWVEPA